MTKLIDLGNGRFVKSADILVVRQWAEGEAVPSDLLWAGSVGKVVLRDGNEMPIYREAAAVAKDANAAQ